MQKAADTFQISLNYEGKDIDVVVDDEQVANLLLNDVQAALNFLEQFDLENVTGPLILKSGNIAQSQVLPSKATSQDTSLNKNAAEQIWTRKKQTERDLEATALLLGLRQKHSKEFDDRKTNKTKLWHQISQTLIDNNFSVGANGAERCRQKFTNLVKTYINYINKQKKTGEGICDLPPFYDEIHLIMGSKHKINPTSLIDSMDQSVSVTPDRSQSHEETDLENETSHQQIPCCSSSDESTSRFKNVRHKVKPLSKSDLILNEISKDRESRESQFNFVRVHLSKASEQRDRFLDILERAFPKKRKRQESSESDS